MASDLDKVSLNPCCSGICSLSIKNGMITTESLSLNPCCSGICSLRCSDYPFTVDEFKVLILVVVEYAL